MKPENPGTRPEQSTPLSQQERAARLSLLGLLLVAAYYFYGLYRLGSWDLVSASGRAGEHILRNTVLLGIALEVMHSYLLQPSRRGETLEDERDGQIRSQATRYAFGVCVAGLFTLTWQLYSEHYLPPATHLPSGMLPHLPLMVLLLAFAVKYLTEIWLYWKDRV